MASSATGYVFAATVEFWLEWLEALVLELPESMRVCNCAASALVTQRAVAAWSGPHDATSGVPLNGAGR